MPEHYLDQIAHEEFAERNSEMIHLVATETREMMSRNLLNSTITLQNLASLFLAELLERCDFIKSFTISFSDLISLSKNTDIVTEAKNVFQRKSFSERSAYQLI